MALWTLQGFFKKMNETAQNFQNSANLPFTKSACLHRIYFGSFSNLQGKESLPSFENPTRVHLSKDFISAALTCEVKSTKNADPSSGTRFTGLNCEFRAQLCSRCLVDGW